MGTRVLYLARHGAADAFGELTDVGRRQSALLGERLAPLPVTTVWHSPLPRAAASAAVVARHLPGAAVAEAAELVDHVPHVPSPGEMPPSWAGFFDGWDEAQADAGRRTADALVARFAAPPDPASGPDVHEVLLTHDYPIAWLVRDALGAPLVRWLGLASANTALTVIEHRAGQAPNLVMFNDQTHLPAELRWTGFGGAGRP
ncbi:histidine phosphatase family protein [Oerskovia jenensis]|uniref:histidine phosphatase family protein n=1 Tax=Oerskovia jenensis TaxID=162169 RepID=UPI0036D7E6A1